jgi:hypothetical protein
MPEPVSPTGSTPNEISIVRSIASMDRAARLHGDRCTQVDKKMSESVGKFQKISNYSNKRSKARHAGRHMDVCVRRQRVGCGQRWVGSGRKADGVLEITGCVRDRGRLAAEPGPFGRWGLL